MKLIKTLNTLLLFCILSLTMHANDTHSHGNATGSIIIEKNTLALHLNLPSESIIGFEGAPKTQQEKNRIAQAKQQLKDEPLFEFYTKKSWFQAKKQIKLSLDKKSIDFVSLEKDKHEDHHHHDHKKDEEEHSDIILKAYYTLKEPTSIKQLETRLFLLFPSLETLELSYIQNNNQKHITLSQKNPTQTLSSY